MTTKKKEVTLESLDSDIKSVKKEVKNISERVSTLENNSTVEETKVVSVTDVSLPPKEKRVRVKYQYIPRPLEDYTPEEISLISRSGKAEEYFNIGDTKTITIGGETYTATIIAFNHYKDIDGKICGITFQTMLNNDYLMNKDNTNKGGYVCSDLRQDLYELYNNLNKDWKKVIRKTEIRTIINTYDGEVGVFGSYDYFFIPSAYEIFGESLGIRDAEIYKKEGTPIPYLYSHRAKGDWYWTRSSCLGDSTHFWRVGYNGDLLSNYASCSAGVAACWCI